MMTPEALIRKFESLKSKRQTWDSLWQDIATYTNPRKDNILVYNTPGTKKYNDILDSTAINSAELLSGALHSMLTNPVGYFFNLTTGNFELDQKDPVRKWFQAVVRTIHSTLANTNFQTEIHEYYIDLVTFGLGTILIEEDEENIIRFGSKPIQENYLDQNRHGMIDTTMRCFKYTPKDLVEDFGLENIPEDIQKEYKDGKEPEYEVIHAVYPRMATDKKFKFKYYSKYILKAKKIFLKEGGFRQNPYVCGRWTKQAGEIYGRGCGEKGLPVTRLANLMQETVIRSSQKVIDPPMQAPDDGFIYPLTTRPAGINFYRAGSTDRIEPLFNMARIDYGIEIVSNVQLNIREAFYVDQLKLRDGPQMTATEVMERQEQALRFLGPMLGRQEVEFLQPTVTRIYDIMERKGMFPELPQELADLGKPIKVKFSSVMAMSQRQSEVQNIQRTMQNITPFISINPSAMDNFDVDAAVRYVGKLFNFPQELIFDMEVVEQKRQQRAEAAQAQEQQMQEQEEMAGAAKVMQATKPQQAG